MRKIFLIDNNRYFTYEDLLGSVNKQTYYYPFHKTSFLYEYFINLIVSLIYDKPLLLLDSDLIPSEIEGVDKSVINKPEELSNITFQTIEELISKIQSSESKITIFTSGTTGQPKKVIHTITSLTRNVRCGEKYFSNIWGFAYNPTHMAGLQVFFQAFENKNTIINIFNKSRTEVYDMIDQYDITNISATPTFYRLLLPVESKYESIIRITLGGEKSDKHLYDSIIQIFPNAKITNVYASTEAGSLFATQGDCFQIPTTIRDKFKVVNNELLIHKSLLGQSDSFSLIEDYYCSGDLIEWEDFKAGLFRFKSRKNELINIGGYKINPYEIEVILLSIPGIRQVSVYGKANSVMGNILCADILLEKGIHLTELEVKKNLKRQLQDFKIPRRIRFVESLPLTRTGKLKRK